MLYPLHMLFSFEWNKKIIMNTELEIIWKEKVVPYFKVQSQHVPR
jgi:hypothetical protein